MSLLTAVVVGVPSLLRMWKGQPVAVPLSSAPSLPPLILMSLSMMLMMWMMIRGHWGLLMVERAMSARQKFVPIVSCLRHATHTIVTIASVGMLSQLNSFVSVSSSVVLLSSPDFWTRKKMKTIKGYRISDDHHEKQLKKKVLLPGMLQTL